MVLNPINSPRTRRGFTFIEVLFSVIILGVGLIMVAAMLPVAIKQSDDTLGEITAKATAESGFGFVRATATSNNLLATAFPSGKPAMVWSTSIGGVLASNVNQGYITPLFQVNNPLGLIRGSQVNSTDRRFAWVPFYYREEGSSTATLWCIGIRLRNTETMPNGTYSVNSFARVFNGPWLVRAYITDSTDGSPDRIRFQQHEPADGTSRYPGAAGSGAFVILNEFLDVAPSAPNADHQATLAMTSDAQTAPRYGRVLKLGTRISDSEFELDPNYDIPMLRGPDKILNTPDDIADTNFSTEREVSVWIVGVGRGSRVEIDPTNVDFDNENDDGLNQTDESKNPFKGAPQDVVIVAGRISVD